MTILVLGTFGIWAYHAVKNPRLLDTEQHQEQMAAIPLMGNNETGKTVEIDQLNAGQELIENPVNLLGDRE